MKRYDYQVKGSEWLQNRTRGLLRFKAGYGKSVTLLDAACVGILTSAPILILCPKSVIGSWNQQIKIWGYSKYNIQVLNWDKLLNFATLKRLKQTKWSVIIGDESHKCLRNPDTRRAIAFSELIHRHKDARLYLATATVAGNSALDYYKTFSILFKKDFGEVKTWQKKFCEAMSSDYSYSGIEYKGFKESELPKLKDMLGKCSFNVTDEEAALCLPPEVVIELPQQAESGHLAELLELDSELLEKIILEGGSIPAHIATYVKAVGLAKVVAVCDWVNTFPENESLVIFAWHREVVHQIATQLNIPSIDGSTTQATRDELVEQFQTAKIKRLVLNIQTGGTGISLHQNCNNVLYAELPWSATNYTQSKARIRRIGSINPCFYNVMTLNGTIDTRILEVLEYKQRNIDKIEG